VSGRQDPPLSGAVFLNADRRIVRMELGNRIQH
jgi:inner membrane protein